MVKFDAKMVLVILVGYIAGSYPLGAVAVFRTEFAGDSDLRVYVTQYKAEADLIVFQTRNRFDGGSNEGIWYWTEFRAEAYWTVFLTSVRGQANTVVFFTANRSEAGWQRKSSPSPNPEKSVSRSKRR